MEIALLIALLLLAAVLYFFMERKRKKNNYSISYVFLLVLILISLFIAIHLIFCYGLGFPASINQTESDLALRSADWLSFLGSYLSFSGALVMAFIVYRQSKIIDELTISEYKPTMSISIISCNKSTEYRKGEFKENNIIQVLPTSSEPFYTYYCDCKETGKNTAFEDYSVLLFVEIYNHSKSPVNQLSFESIDFSSIKSDKGHFKYSKRGGNWDLADGLTHIIPGKKLKRCFLINKIPTDFGICWMKFKFIYADSQLFEQCFLVSKVEGGVLTFLNIGDPN